MFIIPLQNAVKNPKLTPVVHLQTQPKTLCYKDGNFSYNKTNYLRDKL